MRISMIEFPVCGRASLGNCVKDRGLVRGGFNFVLDDAIGETRAFAALGGDPQRLSHLAKRLSPFSDGDFDVPVGHAFAQAYVHK